MRRECLHPPSPRLRRSRHGAAVGKPGLASLLAALRVTAELNNREAQDRPEAEPLTGESQIPSKFPKKGKMKNRIRLSCAFSLFLNSEALDLLGIWDLGFGISREGFGVKIVFPK